ncbi:DUF456 domain-containing protein [Nocardioides marmoriginsengisoli]|uniref:DUF456 domain-containing protein n=1 Tax=Nocardioides marmoriginsengisoli TaxID=661483 RepID=A0A3N0CN51_9ACTN|nr:DUF456 domain-containing protein [Nocardioides marmoriginsengisoli]RNL64894.1 DUF456 domain-containing protein [Nocardioides marmoriginsengisoli]
MTALEFLLALVIAVGLVGILVPLLPGSLLVIGAVLVWAVQLDEPTGWVVLAAAGALVSTGTVVKYLIPGRQLQRSGVPNRTLLAGGVLGIVGFFVIPIVGLPLGFVLGIYLAEWKRVSAADAWPATVAAVKAVGLGMLIELTFSVLAAVAWGIGVLAT